MSVDAMDFHAFLIMCFRESRMKNRIFLINYLLEIKKTSMRNGNSLVDV